MMPSTKNRNEKLVYTAVCADFFRAKHMNIINEARKIGNLMVGVLTDEAIAPYKRVSVSYYEKRKIVVENIRGVWKVVPQYILDYTENLRKYKPDIVTNSDDWPTLNSNYVY